LLHLQSAAAAAAPLLQLAYSTYALKHYVLSLELEKIHWAEILS
jgi:hypothetical protein